MVGIIGKRKTGIVANFAEWLTRGGNRNTGRSLGLGIEVGTTSSRGRRHLTNRRD
jgi:hypothetical protein